MARKYRSEESTMPDIITAIRQLRSEVSKISRTPQLPNSSLDTGTIYVRGGDIRVLNADGTPAVTILSGIPDIDFYAPGLAFDGDLAAIFSLQYPPQFGGGGNVAAIQMYIEDYTTFEPNGGKVLLTRDSAYLSHQPSHIGQVEAYYWAGRRSLDGTYGYLQVQGRFSNQLVNNNQDALTVGSFSTGAGFSSFTWSYGVTFLADMFPVVTLLDGAANVAWVLRSFSNSSFTVAWATNTTDKTINFWAFRAA